MMKQMSLFHRPGHAVACVIGVLLVILGKPRVVFAFVRTIPVFGWTSKCARCMAIADAASLFDASSLTTAVVETFDGSKIVDPVVVSSVFWSWMQAKLLSVVIGQFLAAIVFLTFASVAAAQIQSVTGFVNSKLFGEERQEKTTGSVMNNARTSSGVVEPNFGRLLLCIVIDVIGSSSELIPVLGEVSDVVWAPIAGILLRSLYGSNVLFGLEFAEEILPITDILPLATICWVVDTYYRDSGLAKTLGLGMFAPVSRGQSEIIDVSSQRETERRLPDDHDRRR